MVVYLSEHDKSWFYKRAPIHRLPKDKANGIKRIVRDKHALLEKGMGRPLLFLHGLFGGIYNYIEVFQHFANSYRVIMPYLPMYDQNLEETTVFSLGKYLRSLVRDLDLKDGVVIAGTSTGAGVAIVYATLPGNVAKGIILSGSIGLTSTPLKLDMPLQRKNYESVKYHARAIFYNTSLAPNEMVDEIYNVIQNNELATKALYLTRSATKQKMPHLIESVKVPTLLLWGENDSITPVEVAYEFNRMISNSILKIIPQCGHAVSHEKPGDFIREVTQFLQHINYW